MHGHHSQDAVEYLADEPERVLHGRGSGNVRTRRVWPPKVV
jgi:hypothetical protein